MPVRKASRDEGPALIDEVTHGRYRHKRTHFATSHVQMCVIARNSHTWGVYCDAKFAFVLTQTIAFDLLW